MPIFEVNSECLVIRCFLVFETDNFKLFVKMQQIISHKFEYADTDLTTDPFKVCNSLYFFFNSHTYHNSLHNLCGAHI